ncbi:MAG TPA: hypothetical protein VFO16_23660 [Pseudonocardiaceae bacterium]|nr:hypothetical protein [Pseudonocardiaceae bacterium]
MINKSVADTTGVRALATAVRDGELTSGQRECLAALLIDVDTAARLAPRVREYYPDCDAAAVGYLTGNWQQVITAYTSLLAAARPGGGEYAA